MTRLHRWIERTTGIFFGAFEVNAKTEGGAPLADQWVIVGPVRGNGKVMPGFSVSIGSHGVFVAYIRGDAR